MTPLPLIKINEDMQELLCIIYHPCTLPPSSSSLLFSGTCTCLCGPPLFLPRFDSINVNAILTPLQTSPSYLNTHAQQQCYPRRIEVLGSGELCQRGNNTFAHQQQQTLVGLKPSFQTIAVLIPSVVLESPEPSEYLSLLATTIRIYHQELVASLSDRRACTLHNLKSYALSTYHRSHTHPPTLLSSSRRLRRTSTPTVRLHTASTSVDPQSSTPFFGTSEDPLPHSSSKLFSPTLDTHRRDVYLPLHPPCVWLHQRKPPMHSRISLLVCPESIIHL